MIVHSSSQAFSPHQAHRETNLASRNKQVDADKNTQESSKTKITTAFQNNPEEKHRIQALRVRDQEVRSHERAHAAAAGSLSKGAPSFEFQRGPNGQLYAVGGEVQIDTSGVPGDPEATLAKAQQIQQAALAPSQPSAQDRSVAIAAAAMAAEARAELASQGTHGDTGNTNNEKNEASFQRITTKINDAYNTVTDAETQRSVALVDLVA